MSVKSLPKLSEVRSETQPKLVALRQMVKTASDMMLSSASRNSPKKFLLRMATVDVICKLLFGLIMMIFYGFFLLFDDTYA